MSPQKAQPGISSRRFPRARRRVTLGAKGLPKDVAEAMARAAIDGAIAGKIKDLSISVGRNLGTKQNEALEVVFEPCQGEAAELAELAGIAAAAVVAGDWAPYQAWAPSKPARPRVRRNKLATLKRRLARIERQLKDIQS